LSDKCAQLTPVSIWWTGVTNSFFYNPPTLLLRRWPHKQQQEFHQKRITERELDGH
jgi:hypothetical protein